MTTKRDKSASPVGLTSISRIAESTDACRRCGLCSSVCPVFDVLGLECASPRGKLQLVAAAGQGDLSCTKELEKALCLCVGCGACSERCPNLVMAKETLLAAKQVLPGKRPGRVFRIAAGLMSREKTISHAAGIAKSLRPLWASSLPDDQGLVMRLAKPGARFPKLAETNLKKIWPRNEKNGKPVSLMPRDGSPNAIAGIFPGCIHTYLTPKAGISLARVLAAAGFRVDLLENTGCCGLPALSAGNTKQAQKAMAHNLDVIDIEKYSVIVTPCASCAAMLKVHYPALASKTGYNQAGIAERLAAKVQVLSQVLAKHTGKIAQREKVTKEGTETIAYHTPCHLAKALGDSTSGPKVMQRIENAGYRQTKPACCGQGGLFGVENPEISGKIGSKAAKILLGTGASTVATECSGCYLQLYDLLWRENRKAEVIWLAEAIERFGLAGT
ncbi:MAG: (Fe-S)-binding protein [Deltaproteobacteria bacterium]|nr:(Fe-S)-binding protein [Deltaproteobacteria bacterium]